MEYVVSDIHGEYELLSKLLDNIKFGSGDKLYVLGDFIDKGKSSIKVTELLFSMKNVECIMGNHEYALIKRYRAMLREGVSDEELLDTLNEHFPTERGKLNFEILEKMELLPYYIEKEEWIGVHASVGMINNHFVPFEYVSVEQLLYDRSLALPQIVPICDKCIIFGHTLIRSITNKDDIVFYPRQESLRGSDKIADYAKIHIDTAAFLSGKLGCVRLDDCKVIYAE